MAAIDFDLIVIGGGINGSGIARDAQGRGLRVLLVEQDDLAQHTSSASTKLIHGGLRYLEYYKFRLVRKALQEREILLRAAPHIIRPLRFVMPHDYSMRPSWLIRVGLFLYDHLTRRELLEGSKSLQLAAHPAGVPLQKTYQKAFAYSDGWVDDARLVVLNAVDARERGATIFTRTRCIGATRFSDQWRVELQNQLTGSVSCISARIVVNATGPWVASLLKKELHVQSTYTLRLVKGSHIVVPKLFNHSYAYLFQNPDRRIIFAIPYEDKFTLIGTTDIEYTGDPAQVKIDANEINYLCAMASRYFYAKVKAEDVVHSYSGVRPLLNDAATNATSVTRDYWLEVNMEGGAPILSVFGGKITTYRKLAEEVLTQLLPILKVQTKCWTAQACLPGGDMLDGDFEHFWISLKKHYSWLPEHMLRRLASAYGTRIHQVIRSATSIKELGEEIFSGFYEAELNYLCTTEWARTVEDILWRRTKLGLHVTESETQLLKIFMEAQFPHFTNCT